MLKKFSTVIIHFFYSLFNQIQERTKTSNSIRINLNVFRANSGNWAIYKELSLQSANAFPLQLCRLAHADEISNLISIDFDDNSDIDYGMLDDLFSRFGSDKGLHGYSPAYWHILKSIPSNPTIIEIGVGTNKPGRISSMGAFGHPCASLRVWNSMMPEAIIYGCDIEVDFDLQFTDVKLLQLNQLDLAHWNNLIEFFGPESVDLLIDDGLHTTEANINSLMFALKSLKAGGFFVIEDVRDETLVVWNYVASIKACSDFKFSRFRGKTNNLIIVRRKV
jgi:hypothetical protein